MTEVLDFAILQEEAAAAFYSQWADKMEAPAMREALTGFAREEQGHREKLLKVKSGKTLEPAADKVMDLRLADYLVEMTPSLDMRYQDILVVAMKKEKAAFMLYNHLAAATHTGELKNLFLALAAEEAKHKLRFELEYDDQLKDN